MAAEKLSTGLTYLIRYGQMFTATGAKQKAKFNI